MQQIQRRCQVDRQGILPAVLLRRGPRLRRCQLLPFVAHAAAAVTLAFAATSIAAAVAAADQPASALALAAAIAIALAADDVAFAAADAAAFAAADAAAQPAAAGGKALAAADAAAITAAAISIAAAVVLTKHVAADAAVPVPGHGRLCGHLEVQEQVPLAGVKRSAGQWVHRALVAPA